MNAAKQALRQRLRQEPVPGNDAALCRRILESPWFSEASTVMAYMAMPSEPDLGPVIAEILARGKALVLPRCEEGCRLSARRVNSLERLIPGAFGIPEPGPELPEADPEEIDLVLVPGMAFDRAGRRLGRGKGYYDRFLRRCPGRTMGVCRRTLEEIPTEDHDVPMDAVATEDQVLYFRTEGGTK